MQSHFRVRHAHTYTFFLYILQPQIGCSYSLKPLFCLHVYMGEYDVHTHKHTQSSHTLLWFISTKLLRRRQTGHWELLQYLGVSSRPAPLSSSKLRLRLKAAASCWTPPERLVGSAWCTLLPCSLAARDSSRSRAWLSAWRCSITWEKTSQYFKEVV